MEAPCCKVLHRWETELGSLCFYNTGLSCNSNASKCKEMIHVLFRADPAATTAKNTKLPERWAYENNHVGALAELAKVKEVEPDIMDSSLGKLVLKDEEREWRRQMLVLKDEEREWRRQMLEQLTHQNQLIALIAKKTLGSEQVQDNDASEAKC